MSIEQQYRDFREALAIVRMVAGTSYDNMNVSAAWMCVRTFDAMHRRRVVDFAREWNARTDPMEYSLNFAASEYGNLFDRR